MGYQHLQVTVYTAFASQEQNFLQEAPIHEQGVSSILQPRAHFPEKQHNQR